MPGRVRKDCCHCYWFVWWGTKLNENVGEMRKGGEGKGETGGGKIRQPLEIARSEQGVQVFSVEMEERRLYMEREKAVC
jgi:hypothetical protein